MQFLGSDVCETLVWCYWVGGMTSLVILVVLKACAQQDGPLLRALADTSKLRDRSPSTAPHSLPDVPKTWFLHFYTIGLTCSVLAMWWHIHLVNQIPSVLDVLRDPRLMSLFLMIVQVRTALSLSPPPPLSLSPSLSLVHHRPCCILMHCP